MVENYLLNMNKSSILPVTFTLETEHEVHLMYELLGRFHFEDMRTLLGDSCSTEQWRNTVLDIYGIVEELKEAGYRHAEGKLHMTEITE